MRRILSLGAFAAFGAIISVCSSSVARPVDATCYMQTSSGQILNLGVSLCGDTPPSKGTTAIGNEAAFLAEFHREAARRSPADIRSLMGFSSSDEARTVVDHAKLYCEGRSLGMTDMELRRSSRASARSGSRSSRASALTIEISNDLASKHFCLQFAQQ